MSISLRVDDGKHRPVTWLELLFDLAFVISVGKLSHIMTHGFSLGALFTFCGLFIPVWWVWNQFTWYSSHFDNDDLFFRGFMLLAIVGILALSGGIVRFSSGDPTRFVIAYVLVHLLLLGAWLRALRHVQAFRPYILFKMTGIALGIAFWLPSLAISGNARYIFFALGTLLQLLMPILAWRTVRKMISVHAHHIRERHGLFTMIVIGECLVSLGTAATAPVSAVLLMNGALCFSLLVFLWWSYFSWKYDPVNLQRTSCTFIFNYGHLVIYLGLAIISAGILLIMRTAAAPDHASVGYGFLGAGGLIFIVSLVAMNALSADRRRVPGIPVSRHSADPAHTRPPS